MLGRTSRFGILTALAAGLASLTAATAAPASAQTGSAAAKKAVSTTTSSLTGWQPVSSYPVSSWTGGQGLATTTDAGTSIVYRGLGSIPLRLYLQGWDHVGDPGGYNGYIVDAYEGSSTATAKLFEVTTPSGNHYDFVHHFVAGTEMPNNSFAAVAPSGQWLVSGEWNQMNRLLVFPTPVVAQPASQTELRLAATITLNPSVSRIQGCDFIDSATLVCTSDTSPQQLLKVALDGPINGTAQNATVTSLGYLPLESVCTGTFEAEGIDYAPGPQLMRFEVVPPSPCSISTRVYVYKPAP
jgi:hypothetical protein